MAKITKPDMTYVWASGGSKTAPSNVKIQTGWIVEKPEFEKMNWVQNRQDGSLAYLFQMGVPEWDSAVEYQYSATYRSYVQRNGLVYKALQVGTNKDPASEAAYWTLAFDDKAAAATVQTNLNTHITNYGTLAGLTNAATARTNLDVYSTTQVNGALALKALLGGSNSQLFLVANGTTGYEAVNYSQLITKAPVAGNSSQEFAVAAATTGNSAVNKTQAEALASGAVVSAMPTGAMIMWPTATAPSGFVEAAGQSTAPYPSLTPIYGSNLPDMRGEFVRGFDNGRGVDGGRAIRSSQTDELKAHTHDYFLWSPGGGGYSDGMANDTITDNRPTTPTTSTGGSETRPRNVAMMYIIKI